MGALEPPQTPRWWKSPASSKSTRPNERVVASKASGRPEIGQRSARDQPETGQRPARDRPERTDGERGPRSHMRDPEQEDRNGVGWGPGVGWVLGHEPHWSLGNG